MALSVFPNIHPGHSPPFCKLWSLPNVTQGFGAAGLWLGRNHCRKKKELWVIASRLLGCIQSSRPEGTGTLGAALLVQRSWVMCRGQTCPLQWDHHHFSPSLCYLSLIMYFFKLSLLTKYSVDHNRLKTQLGICPAAAAFGCVLLIKRAWLCTT